MSLGVKLTYFDIRGLAELPRLLLTVAGVPFTDDRIKFEKKEDGSFERGDWEQRKPNTPYGQVPYLTVNGTQIAQSGAIVRYISHTYGLAGVGAVEHALIDAGYEAVADIRRSWQQAKADPAKLADFFSKGLPEGLAALNKNVAGQTYFGASNKLSFVDVAIYYLFFALETENKDAVHAAFANNPKLGAIHHAVASNAHISAYVKARKQTIF